MAININISDADLSVLATDQQSRDDIAILKTDKVDLQTLTNSGIVDRAKNISSTDLNILVSNGSYSGNLLLNAPDTGFYYIEVIRHGIGESYILQRITGITGANMNKTFQRVKNSTVWSEWQLVTPKINRLQNNTDLQTQLKITTDGNEKKTVYSLKIDNLKPTDIIVLMSQVEVTNPKTYNVGLGRMLLAANTSTDVTGNVVSTGVMSNITPDMHHGIAQIQAIDTVRTGTVYYNLVVWALASMAGANDYAVVEQGYGGITAIVISQ